MIVPDKRSEWTGILNPGERVVWQGQPDASLDFSGLRTGRLISGGFILAFSLFWLVVVIGNIGAQPEALIFVAIGVPLLAKAVDIATCRILSDSWRRKRTWYSLSNQRAFIATNFLGRKTLDAYPITAQTIIEHEDLDPGNIWFATDFRTTRDGSQRMRIGFARIKNSRHVNDLMRDIQRGTP